MAENFRIYFGINWPHCGDCMLFMCFTARSPTAEFFLDAGATNLN